jgi:hypothetical protein
MPALAEGRRGVLEVVASVDHEADVVEPGVLGVERGAATGSQAEQGALRGLVDGAAVEVLGSAVLLGVGDGVGLVNRSRPAEYLVVEGLGSRDVGHGDADVGEA